MNEFSYEEHHLGTDVMISLICKEPAEADKIAQDLYKQIHEAELEFSRFLPSSSLSQLNLLGTKKVSPLFTHVLKTALDISKLTGQVFNPLVQVARLGYTKTFSELEKEINPLPVTYNTNIDEVIIDELNNVIMLAPNQQLDFGGILKGYLATKLADYTKQTYSTCPGLIINIGGDIATRGLDELHHPFMFMLYNPITNEETPITLTDTSLATSGTYLRHWDTSSGSKHHIVDAATRDNPDTKQVATTIIHRSGAWSEALTKLFIIKGVAKAMSICPPTTNQYQYFCVDNSGAVTSSLI